MTQTDPSTQWWTTGDIAEYIGVSPWTVKAYVAREQMPQPDGWIGGSIRVWRPSVIREWHANRPGRGRWGDRKDKQAA